MVLEALVLAIGRSPIIRVVSIELVRSALEMSLNDIVSGDRVNLNVVWKTLEPLPGFDARSASPPMCWMKAQEAKLRLRVDLPPALAAMKASEQATIAAMCPVRPRELEHVLAGFDAPAPGELTAPVEVPIERSQRRTWPPPDDSARPRRTTKPPGYAAPAKKVDSGPSPVRKMLGYVAGAISVITLVFVGMTVFRACDTRVKYEKIEASDLGGIPVKNPRALGSQVGATITDPSWMSHPEAERRKQMTEAFKQLQNQHVTVFYVQDEQQHMLASAQFRGHEIVVVFY